MSGNVSSRAVPGRPRAHRATEPPAGPNGPVGTSAPARGPAPQVPAAQPHAPQVPAQSTGSRPAYAGRLGTVRAYIALTKPRIIELLLITTVPAMMLAAGGFPSPWLVLATLAGGSLAAGSANVLNCYIDRDIDVVMRRTSRRATAQGQVSARGVLVFGIALGIASLALLAVTTTWLATLLTFLAIIGYVVGYTIGLKRRTPSNIVWGGAAGCMPTLIGWAAVTGSLAWPALVMFMIVFFWTPPHFWALAMRFKDDYARAGVPMLPVVATPQVVADRIVVYSWVMVAVSLLLIPVMTPLYPVAAVLLGALFLLEAHRVRIRVRNGGEPKPMRLFHWSTTYLTLLFVVIGVDTLLPL